MNAIVQELTDDIRKLMDNRNADDCMMAICYIMSFMLETCATSDLERIKVVSRVVDEVCRLSGIPPIEIRLKPEKDQIALSTSQTTVS